LMISTF
jgi:hypothetical protein